MMSISQDMLRRMQADDTRLRQTETKETPFLDHGTAMPAGYPLNVPYFRTDLGLWIYSDGTRQLTAEEFQCDVAAYARNPMPFAGAGATTLLIGPQRTDYASYYVRAKAYLDVLTTNNATNYWQCSLYLGATSVWTFTTAGDAPNTGLNKEDSSAGVTTGALYAKLDAVKAGAGAAPGSLFIAVSFWYRLIIP
jgi:hypothetical protein